MFFVMLTVQVPADKTPGDTFCRTARMDDGAGCVHSVDAVRERCYNKVSIMAFTSTLEMCLQLFLLLHIPTRSFHAVRL